MADGRLKGLHYERPPLIRNVEQPLHAPDRRTTVTLAIGLGRSLMRALAVMSEVHGESTVDFTMQRQVVWNIGVMYGAGHFPLYARIGRTCSRTMGET